MNPVKPLLLAIAVVSFQVSAETAYRSVDDQGNVTFSDSPVSGAAQKEKIRIDAPAPSTDRVQETRQRESELQKAASQTGTSPAPNRAEQRKAAQQNVRDAEKRLEEAKQVREGDRRGTAGGGSRLLPAYHERVRAAEANVEHAREQLQQTR